MYKLQQFQLEFSMARERGGTYSDESCTTQTNLKDSSHFVRSNGSQLEANEGSTPASNSRGFQNGNAEVVSSFTPSGNALPQEKNTNTLSNHGDEAKDSTTGLLGSSPNISEAIHPVMLSEVAVDKDGAKGCVTSGLNSSLLVGKTTETALLDEESLLACVVRTIPPGFDGRIRISSTLPNRLAEMLAPLHWYDYKKKYGRLDIFLRGHPELFLIEGDHIQVQEGALEVIASMAAHVKLHAAAVAAAAVSSRSSLLPSVAVPSHGPILTEESLIH